ncbi:hypothetical protein BKI52_16190 [marine bacterium AO1-C]|nr:hypothetical protein BKI52_16190 [marine bacterium AO1-C]
MNILSKAIAYGLLIIMFVACSKKDNPTPTTSNAPQKIFQEFWEIYDRYYPLMHRKGINWQDVYNTYNAQINDNTTDAELFSYFSTIMSTIIKDGHSNLDYNNQSAGFQPEENANIQQMLQNNTDKQVSFVASSANNPYISYGSLVSDATIGYIKSKQFEPVNESDQEFNNFKKIVDEALLALKDKTGIIIDIRTNGGGQGPYAFYLAGRFFVNNSETIRKARYKTKIGSTEASLSSFVETASQNFEGYDDARAEGGRVGATFADENTVTKSGTFQFTKKVALLTANGTASAAELFTIAMKTQTQVKTIGDKTFGIFAGSDIFTLRNGSGKWKTRVSVHDVEVKYKGVFQSFEGIGIPPDQSILPTATEVNAGKDTHIEAAVQYIKL